MQNDHDHENGCFHRIVRALHVKLHHITATDIVNVAVMTDITARVGHHPPALAATVAAGAYLLLAAIWHTD